MSAHITVTKWGLDIRCDTCVYQHGTPIIPCDNGTICNQIEGYTKGNEPPNFPVPAIPQIYDWDYSLYIFLLENYAFEGEDNLDDE